MTEKRAQKTGAPRAEAVGLGQRTYITIDAPVHVATIVVFEGGGVKKEVLLNFISAEIEYKGPGQALEASVEFKLANGEILRFEGLCTVIRRLRVEKEVAIDGRVRFR